MSKCLKHHVQWTEARHKRLQIVGFHVYEVPKGHSWDDEAAQRLVGLGLGAGLDCRGCAGTLVTEGFLS